MSDKTIVYIVVAIVIAHFIFALAWLLYKIYAAPKSKNDTLDKENDKHL